MKRFATFSLIGVVNTIIHFVVFMLLFETLGVHYLLASTLGFVFAVLNSYWMNSRWTFAELARRDSGEFFRFVTVSVAALLVNFCCMWVLVDLWSLYPPLAQALSILITLLVNFLGNRYWAFAQTPRSSDS